MQKDFHFYCVGVLAKAAGFKNNDALTIAYASQYVDDATESEPINLGPHIFDPVRTSHIGLQAYEWSVQKRVYIPFHFIPAKPIRSENGSYLTKPNSNFAQQVLNEAIRETDPKFRLFRIGVALHTFADSWAHQGFSGRRNKENDVEGIHLFGRKKWKHLLLENIFLDFLPQIGHAEAGYFPDQSYQNWKYKNGNGNEFIERDNSDIFLDAAKTIYTKLLDVEKQESDPVLSWDDISGEIVKLLNYKQKDINKRCKKWRKQFKKMFAPYKFDYNRLNWREEALEPKAKANVDWDDFDPTKFRTIEFKMKPGFYESSWTCFHKAALRQRHYVLENLL